MLSRSAARVEACAQNMSNVTTPGYKARKQFSQFISSASSTSDRSEIGTLVSGTDFTNGSLQNTGNPLDFAISGSGFFVVRNADGVFYTRDGQFSRDPDGRLVNASGMALQSLSGDVVVGPTDPKVLPDGTVLSDNEPVARVAVVNFENEKSLKSVSGSVFMADERDAMPATAEVRQGMLEASNVSTAAEMISIMASLRSAGAGQKVVQLYDDLMGRAVTAFGQS